MKEDKRIRFFNWLRFVVFKEDRHTYPSKLMRIIEAVLFPLDYLYCYQTRFKYDPRKYLYTIAGQVVGKGVFHCMSEKKEGDFIILRKNSRGHWMTAEGKDVTNERS